MKVNGDDGESRILELSTSTLNFTPLKTSNAGQYRCQGNINTTVSDTPISDSSDFNLTVQSKILTVHVCIIIMTTFSFQYQSQQ